MISRHLCFDGELDYDTVNELINKIEDKLEKLDEDGMLTLHFSSTGGQIAAAQALISFLNSYSCYINLEAGADLHSCGLDVFMNFIGKASIYHRYCTVVMHLGSRDITRGVKNSQNRKTLEDDLDMSNAIYLTELEQMGVPKHILERVESGEDVYLCYDDYKDFLGTKE